MVEKVVRRLFVGLVVVMLWLMALGGFASSASPLCGSVFRILLYSPYTETCFAPSVTLMLSMAEASYLFVESPRPPF